MRREPDRERNQVDTSAVVAAVLAVLVVVFVLENTKKTDIRFIIPEVTCPLWFALVVPLAVGVAIGWLLAHRRHRD